MVVGSWNPAVHLRISRTSGRIDFSKVQKGAAEGAANLLKAFDEDVTDVFSATIHERTQVEGIGFMKACLKSSLFCLLDE